MEHSWDIDYKQAVKLQKELAARILLKDGYGQVNRIAGVDVRVKAGHLYCAVLVFYYPELAILEKKSVALKATYPYIPGMLSFREGPAVLKCFKNLKTTPQLVFFDGNGYMHPRRLGLASHMGLLLDLPSIGVAKSKLLGSFKEPGQRKGSFSPVEDNGQVIGAALRTRDGTKPVFVSCGHRICLDSAIRFTLAVSKYRIPEPTRQAHNWLKEAF
ncbi:MAG: deoxyribonuclease V [Actinomycetota bacterium]